MRVRPFVLAMSGLTLAASASAQEQLPAAWARLRPGSLLKVVHADTVATIGRFRSVCEGAILLTGPCSLLPSLSCGASNFDVNLRSIQGAMVRRHRFGRSVVRGAMLGAGVGAALGVLAGRTEENSAAEMFLAWTGFLGAVGGATGGLIGALVPQWQPLPPLLTRLDGRRAGEASNGTARR